MPGFRGWLTPPQARERPTFQVDALDTPAGASARVLDRPEPHVPVQTSIASMGDCTVALAGELANRVALCQELGLPKQTPAAAVVLEASRRDKTGFVRRLDGVLAFVLRNGDELLLHRAACGLENLFWCLTSTNSLAFATNLQAIVDLPGVQRRVACGSLHEYLRFLDVSAPNTWYDNVYAVEAGQLLRGYGGQMATMEPKASHVTASPPMDFDTALDTLQGLLRRSVDDALNDVMVPAAFLSGGVDSSLICAMAARSRADLTAITVGFDGGAYDEAPLASRIAKHLGLRHEVLRFGHDDYRAAFDRLTRHLEQPMADPATMATVLALEHCRGRYDVVLDGTGADEAIGAVPPRHVRMAVAWGSLLPIALRGGLVRTMCRVPKLAGYAPILDFEHPADTMIRWKGFSRQEIEALCGEPVSFEHTAFHRTFARFPRRAHLERYTALLNAMPCERLTQASRTAGMHVRYPFCGRDTDEFIRGLPLDFRHLPGEPKRILRALLARHVPREIWDAPKHGFNFPLAEFMSARGHEIVRRHLLESDVWQRTRLLSVDGVQRYARQFVAGDGRLTFCVWALVVLGAWLEHHESLVA